MQADLIQEARRQAEICNACRYCEGYCAVFPALHSQPMLTDGDMTHLANLCHNCRGCYYACQYTAPHEFDLNLPRALADLRQASWEDYAWPHPLARRFQSGGVGLALVIILAVALMVLAFGLFAPKGGDDFYGVMAHHVMVAIFAPAFAFPAVSLWISLRRYWRATGGGAVNWADLSAACGAAGRMKNLAGGHGEGCNFEDEDRFSQARRIAHQAVLYGFGLCLLSTASGTVLHYVFDTPAPYGFWSLPKLLGVPGGLLMVAGSAWLAALKLRADPALGAAAVWGGEMAFIVLLLLVAGSGLLLYAVGSTTVMPAMLALHLGSVLAFFVLTPFTKMAHGFYRMAALIRDAAQRRQSRLRKT